MSIKYIPGKAKIMLDKINIIKKQANMMLRLSVFYIILYTALLISCSPKIKAEYIKQDLYDQNDYLIIWAHSDIQPDRASRRKYYENAIADIDALFKADVALVAGDIVNWPKSDDDFKWYQQAKAASSIKYWYEIAGNHDQKNYINYKKYINMPLHYSVQIGNILLLCMSDESKSPETDISDEAFKWWKDMIINNQDKIIITMTHGYLKQSRMLWTIIQNRNIGKSERFADVLKKYRIDLWLCGHTHLSHSFNKSIRTADDLNGTLFLNVSAIGNGKYNDSESFLLFFKKNSDELIIKSRNHDEKTFNMDDVFYKLSKKFQWNNSPPAVQGMEHDILIEK